MPNDEMQIRGSEVTVPREVVQASCVPRGHQGPRGLLSVVHHLLTGVLVRLSQRGAVLLRGPGNVTSAVWPWTR